jgi:hypothetical protein
MRGGRRRGRAARDGHADSADFAAQGAAAQPVSARGTTVSRPLAGLTRPAAVVWRALAAERLRDLYHLRDKVLTPGARTRINRDLRRAGSATGERSPLKRTYFENA